MFRYHGKRGMPVVTDLLFTSDLDLMICLFIEYKYQKLIDLCGNFTIFTYANGRKSRIY